MTAYLKRSIQKPIREGLDSKIRWEEADHGLIWCWERGRQKREEDAELAAQAERGELPPLAWIGGVEKKLKVDEKRGCLQYLATWQGLRGESLDLDMHASHAIICTKTKQRVIFSDDAKEWVSRKNVETLLDLESSDA